MRAFALFSTLIISTLLQAVFAKLSGIKSMKQNIRFIKHTAYLLRTRKMSLNKFYVNLVWSLFKNREAVYFRPGRA